MRQILCSPTFTISRKTNSKYSLKFIEYYKNCTSYSGGVTETQSSLINHSVSLRPDVPTSAPYTFQDSILSHAEFPRLPSDVKGHAAGTGQGHDRMPSVGVNYSDVTKLRLIQEILQLTHFSSQKLICKLVSPSEDEI